MSLYNFEIGMDRVARPKNIEFDIHKKPEGYYGEKLLHYDFDMSVNAIDSLRTDFLKRVIFPAKRKYIIMKCFLLLAFQAIVLLLVNIAVSYDKIILVICCLVGFLVIIGLIFVWKTLFDDEINFRRNLEAGHTIICEHCLKEITNYDLDMVCPHCGVDEITLRDLLYYCGGDCRSQIRYFACPHCNKEIDTFKGYEGNQLRGIRNE